MFNKILVPLDGSPLAEAVLPYGERFAQSFGGQITILSVLGTLTLRELENRIVARIEARRTPLRTEYLKEVVGDLASRGVKARSRLLSGEPSQCIVDYAQRNGYDLIAMSTHGRTGINRWAYGSVADWVMHNTGTPLLLVRPGKKVTADLGSALRKVVVPLDGSPAAEAALDYGIPIAQAMKLKMQLVRVVTPITFMSDQFSEGYSESAEIAAITEQSREMAEEYLLGIRERLVSPENQTNVIASVGNPAEVITRMTREVSNTLVVMTSHARSGIARTVFGSVAESVVRSCHGPTLVLRPALVKSDRIAEEPVLSGPR